jgi:hypothetical protein
MDTVQERLRRFRVWFIVWFVAQSVLGTATAAWVLGELRHVPFLGRTVGVATAEFTWVAGVFGSFIMLLLALFVLAALLELRPWARLLLLVLGWITVVSAVSDLLVASGGMTLARLTFDVGEHSWRTMRAVTVVTKALDLTFWSWAIYTLQGKTAVRDAFVAEPGAVARGDQS